MKPLIVLFLLAAAGLLAASKSSIPPSVEWTGQVQYRATRDYPGLTPERSKALGFDSYQYELGLRSDGLVVWRKVLP